MDYYISYRENFVGEKQLFEVMKNLHKDIYVEVKSNKTGKERELFFYHPKGTKDLQLGKISLFIEQGFQMIESKETHVKFTLLGTGIIESASADSVLRKEKKINKFLKRKTSTFF